MFSWCKSDGSASWINLAWFMSSTTQGEDLHVLGLLDYIHFVGIPIVATGAKDGEGHGEPRGSLHHGQLCLLVTESVVSVGGGQNRRWAGLDGDFDTVDP